VTSDGAVRDPDDRDDLFAVLCAECSAPIDVDGDDSPPYCCAACEARGPGGGGDR
jgi:hypothetical protein